VSKTVVSFFANIRDEVRLNKALKTENLRLKNQLTLLEKRIIRLQEFDSENKRLRLLLDLKEQVNYNTIPAQVIGRDLSGWSQLIILDKGTRHGIKEDMPVVAGEGVVGKVIETGLYTAKVQLIIDRRSRIGGLMQQSRLVGLVEGTGKEYVVMTYLPRDELVYVNDMVLTSGLGRVFEKGLLIGSVKAIFEEKYGLYKYAKVIPSVQFDKLEEVLIILKDKTDDQ
jgi:rod shape-determining protein MreC